MQGTTPGTVIAAPAPSVDAYDTRSSPEALVGGPEAEAVRRGVLEAARQHEVQLQGDGRLGLLAAWTAERLGPGGAPPPPEVVEFFARHLGLVEPVPHLLSLGQPDPAALQGGVTQSVSQFLDRQPYNRYGAAIVQRQGLTLVVITLSRRWVEMDPVARSARPGTPIHVRGHLLGSLHDPTFAITQPDGRVERQSGGSGQEFDVRLSTREPGPYQIELLAEGPRGDTVVASFPVFVGVAVPESVSLDAQEQRAETDPAVVTENLLALINRSRRSAGLPSLDQNAGLSSVALGHSRDMVEHGFIGHTSPSSGSAVDRVRSAGYQTGLVLENIGRGHSAREIHQGLMSSPAHRASVLNRDVTHVGIGVVADPEGDGSSFVVTEVLVRMTRELDLSQAPRELLRLINAARHARGAPPVEAEPNLMEAAQRAAAEYFEDPSESQQDIVDSASASLRRFSIAFRRVGGLMAVVTRVQDAARLEPTFDADVRYVGIGVTQGTRPDTEPNAIAVVIVLGWPR